MSFENENIEAKLCSYVEGDLDAAARAEVEKYLASNPRYRPLLAEMARSRDMLRQLPHENAPAELLEALSSQLERSSLLDDDDTAHSKRHIRRWPILTAWAAVLLLTCGLAAVIYRVLPSTKTQPEIALLRNTPPTAADSGATQPSFDAPTPVAAAAPSAAEPMDDKLAFAKTDRAMTQNGVKLPSMMSNQLGTFAPGNDNNIPSSNAEPQQRQMFAGMLERDKEKQIAQQQNVVVALKTEDPDAAKSRVAAYLVANGLAYQTVEGPTTSISLETAPTTMPVAVAMADAAEAAKAAPSKDLTITPPLPMNARRVFIARNLTPVQVQNLRDALTAPPSTEPSVAIVAIAGATTKQAELEKAADSPATAPAILAEADDLKKRLSPTTEPSPAPQSAAMSPATTQSAEETKSAGETLAAGDTIRIVARDNGLSDIEAMNEPRTIDADGNITLPLIGKIKAAGQTGQQLQQAIPLAYRAAKSPTDATWTIERTAQAAATTAPVVSTIATQPSTSPIAATPAVTPSVTPVATPAATPVVGPAVMPAIATPMDVTIVIYKDSAPSTMPSTVPATLPTTMP